MRVLSLFDGISCGMVALERVGIPVETYMASEIKPTAIKVSNDNYPDIIRLGDIKTINGFNLPKIDLLIGGSPCQDLSIGKLSQGKQRPGLSGEKSSLFFEYLRVLKETKPKYFLLENVVMPKEDESIFNRLLGVEPIRINSNLVSYQNRERLYWTNIPNVTTPADKGVSFQNFKDSDPDYCSRYKVKKTPSRELMWGGKCPNVTDRDKINCLTVKQDRWNNAGLIEFDDFCRYLTTRELELAQTLPVGYTKSVSIRQAEDVLGDGWTVDVIAHIFSFIPEEDR